MSLRCWPPLWALLPGHARIASVATPGPGPIAAATAPATDLALDWNTAIGNALTTQLKASCPAGTRLYTQIYDEAMRTRAEQLRQRLQDAGGGPLHVAPIENVTRSAALRQQRPPVPWQQPTLIVHDPKVGDCAQVLAQAVQQRWGASGESKVLVTPLPTSLKAQPKTIELWLPTPAGNRASPR